MVGQNGQCRSLHMHVSVGLGRTEQMVAVPVSVPEVAGLDREQCREEGEVGSKPM